MIKQHDKKIGIEAIDTDGCLFMTLLKAGVNFVAGDYDYEKIQRAYRWAIPDYMQDHRTPHKDRCFVISHEEIIRIGLSLLGYPDADIQYLFRNDNPLGKPDMKVGKYTDIDKCNFFAKKVWVTDNGDPYGHFLECEKDYTSLWNPGNGDGKILSHRGYRIRI